MSWSGARPTGAGAGSWTPAGIGDLPATLASFNGRMRQAFVQGNAESFGFINLDPDTREGACFALSVMWTLARKGGTDFFGSATRPSSIALMNKRQVGMARHKASGQSSKTYLDDWLTPEGLLLRDNVEVVYPGTAGAVRSPIGFKYINLQFGSAGHFIAAQITRTDVVFFDPNIGEASFATAQELATWLEQRLLPTYNAVFGLAWYRITTYAATLTMGRQRAT